MSNICSVCKEEISQPVRLEKCGHRVCCLCVFDWIRLNRRKCPECRKSFDRATRIVPLFKTNFEEAQVEWSMSGSASAVGSLMSKRTCVGRNLKKEFLEFKALRAMQCQMAAKKGSKDECLNQDPWWYGHVGREKHLVWRILGLWLLFILLLAGCLHFSVF